LEIKPYFGETNITLLVLEKNSGHFVKYLVLEKRAYFLVLARAWLDRNSTDEASKKGVNLACSGTLLFHLVLESNTRYFRFLGCCS
jgi:hypothetical protein